jgi:hypothetical protein
MSRSILASAAAIALLPMSASDSLAQTFDAVGTRAQGMGGAFVAMADDASAVYWNPAGLAKGAYFSLLIDGNTADLSLDDDVSAGRRSSWILALSTPALGLSYYRLRNSTVRKSATLQHPATFHLESLVTHHAGATLVQSLTDGIAVGVTAKLVRGVAASVVAPADRAEDLLDGWDVLGRSASKVDLDAGIRAGNSVGSIGLTVRNVTEPSFETGGDSELQLGRQVRGGGSIFLLPDWKLAADVDFTKNEGPLGDVRQVSIGTEARVASRAIARGGIRVNTAGDRGRTPAWSIGASYAVAATLLIDAQLSQGSDETLRGWGLAGRVVF